jgi:cytosine deaminase
MPSHSWTFPQTDDFVLANARVPSCLVNGGPLPPAGEGLGACDLLIRGGRLAAIEAPGRIGATAPRMDCDRGIVLPRLVDLHTHLDKGHIWPRRANPDGTHAGARVSVMEDRAANWSADDVRARMDFALRSAYAHGTAAVRTHIDSLGRQAAISWPVFAEMREAWKGRIDLQAVALFPIDFALDDEPMFRQLTALVARHGGVMGGMTCLGAMDEKFHRALARLFEAAAANGLDLDFHVDETDESEARTLAAIADRAMATRFPGRIVAGHCCSLALAPDGEREETIKRVADAGLNVVSLPICNMYLMGRTAHRTPRWRGVTTVHEFAAAGVGVSVASDNTRDPFYAYGDLDLLEVYRESVRILQLDHTGPDWLRLVASAPAEVMGLPELGRLKAGSPADLILLRARSFNEMNARPQNDRAVLVKGRAIDTTPPDYRELDPWVGAP